MIFLILFLIIINIQLNIQNILLFAATYTYSVKLALGSQGNESLQFHKNLQDNSSKEYQLLAGTTHEGINRMVMQSDLRDVYHGVHINGFHPVEMKSPAGDSYQGVVNDFYVQVILKNIIAFHRFTFLKKQREPAKAILLLQFST